jgi:hypothetical protein
MIPACHRDRNSKDQENQQDQPEGDGPGDARVF